MEVHPHMIPLVIGAMMLWNAATADKADAHPMVATVAPTVEEYVRNYYADTPVLAEIARCESRFRQFDEKGQLLRGEAVSQDIGIMQINEYFHAKTADKLGFDIKTMDGNLAYARYLYEKEGTTPWKPSQKCWEKSDAAKKLAKK